MARYSASDTLGIETPPREAAKIARATCTDAYAKINLEPPPPAPGGVQPMWLTGG